MVSCFRVVKFLGFKIFWFPGFQVLGFQILRFQISDFLGCPIELISSRLSLYVQALSLDTHNGHIGLTGGHGHWAIYGQNGLKKTPCTEWLKNL